MPYIEGSRRTPLREMIDDLAKNCRQDPMTASVCCAAMAVMSAPPQIVVLGLISLIDELTSRVDPTNAANDPSKVAGDVNYCISRFLYKFLGMDKMSYARCILAKEVILVQAESFVAKLQVANKVAGFSTLRLVARELDRRFSAGYEDSKMTEHGDFID